MIIFKNEGERSEEPRARLVCPMSDGILAYEQV